MIMSGRRYPQLFKDGKSNQEKTSNNPLTTEDGMTMSNMVDSIPEIQICGEFCKNLGP
jgi:hypothetical protein